MSSVKPPLWETVLVHPQIHSSLEFTLLPQETEREGQRLLQDMEAQIVYVGRRLLNLRPHTF